MVTDEVSLWDVKPIRNAPAQAALNGLAAQIHLNRLACRESWWRDNASVDRRGKTGSISLLPASAGSGTVVKGSGIYIPGQGVQVHVNWGTSISTEFLKEV